MGDTWQAFDEDKNLGDMIKGGYILQPRCIQEGSMAHNPPVDRELWQYFLRSVNYYKHDLMPRGSGFFRLEDIQEDLSWKVGFRKMKYSKSQLSKSIRRMRDAGVATVTKETGGMIVTICKYDYYQDPNNYEGNPFYEGNNGGIMKGSETLDTKETEGVSLNDCGTVGIEGGCEDRRKRYVEHEGNAKATTKDDQYIKNYKKEKNNTHTQYKLKNIQNTSCAREEGEDGMERWAESSKKLLVKNVREWIAQYTPSVALMEFPLTDRQILGIFERMTPDDLKRLLIAMCNKGATKRNRSAYFTLLAFEGRDYIIKQRKLKIATKEGRIRGFLEVK